MCVQIMEDWLFQKCWKLVWTKFVAILLVWSVMWKKHTLPLRVYAAGFWRTVEESDSCAGSGNEKQVHRWKKRIYRGPLRSEGLNPTRPSLFPSLHLSCIRCLSLSLAELTCNPRTLNEASYTGLFLEDLLMSSPHLLYLLWVYYSLFNSCFLSISEFKWSGLNTASRKARVSRRAVVRSPVRLQSYLIGQLHKSLPGA